MAPETPQEQAYFKFREKESESMRNLRHKAFEHVEVVALSLDEVQDRKMEARADDHDIQHLAFLFGEFEPRCYLFVVFECLRRLALTGLLIFVYNGSATQVVVGLFIAVISCVESTSASGAPDNSSLSHFSVMTVGGRHRHAVEQASRRWRGGRRDDSARTRRKF